MISHDFNKLRYLDNLSNFRPVDLDKSTKNHLERKAVTRVQVPELFITKTFFARITIYTQMSLAKNIWRKIVGCENKSSFFFIPHELKGNLRILSC